MPETSNACIVRQLLDSLNARDTSRWAEWLHEDCYQTLPYAPRGDFPTRIEPASEIIFHFDHVLAKRETVNFYDIEIIPAADSDIVFAELKQDSLLSGGGRRYRQIYVFKFVFNKGRIVRWDEYFDPQRVLEAFEGIDGAIGELDHRKAPRS